MLLITNSSNSFPVEISNWQNYSFDFFEFIITVVVPILLTVIITLIFSRISENRIVKQNTYQENLSLLVQYLLSLDRTLVQYRVLLLSYREHFKTYISNDFSSDFADISDNFNEQTVLLLILFSKLRDASPKKDKDHFENLMIEFNQILSMINKCTSDITDSITRKDYKNYNEAIDALRAVPMFQLIQKHTEFVIR